MIQYETDAYLQGTAIEAKGTARKIARILEGTHE